MKPNFYILSIGLLLFATISRSQQVTVGYKGGPDKLSENLRSSLIKNIYGEIDSNICVIAIVDINSKGDISNVLVTSFDNDTLYSKILYKVIMKTKNDWINGTKSDLFFAIPFYFLKQNVNGIVQPHKEISINQYRGDQKLDLIKIKPIEVVQSEIH